MNKIIKGLILAVLICSVILFFLPPTNVFNGQQPSPSKKPFTKPLQETTLPTKFATSSANENVTTISDGEASEQSDSIIDCNATLEQSTDISDDKIADFRLYLQHSGSADDQLAYLLFGSQSPNEDQFAALQSYNKTFPKNKRVLMDLIGLCSANYHHKYCNDKLLNQAIELDGNNAALWLQISNFHAAKQDTQATLHAMENAINATGFNDYYYDNLALFMQTSKGTLDVSFSQRAIMGLGYHAATPVWVSSISSFCFDEANYSDLRNQLCLALGKTIATQSNSLIINAIGLNMQSLAYKREQNEAMQLKAEKEKAELMQGPTNTDIQFKAKVLSLVDEQLFNYWLNNVINLGEAKADELLVEEAITLSKNPDYAPCPKE